MSIPVWFGLNETVMYNISQTGFILDVVLELVVTTLSGNQLNTLLLRMPIHL